MKFILSLVAVLSFAISTALPAADFVLVSENSPPAPIIVYKGAPPRTRDAAVTLAVYIEKISGVRPQIIDGEPQPLPQRAVWVGCQPALKALFPMTDFEFKFPEETLIAANEQHLVIAGRDRWDPAHMQAKGRLAMKTGLQQEYGTANAVYSFLQDQLGVRWLWPDEEDVPKRTSLTFAPFEHRYHPQIRARSGMLAKLSLGDSKEDAAKLWSRHQRVQLDSLESFGGHGFTEWWDKYHESHPDYFALWPDGTRSPHPNPSNTKLCESNPGVWRQWLAEVDEQLQADPTRRVFNASENDGYDYGHCSCEQCRAKDAAEAEKFSFHWKGTTEELPALSDRQVIFANTLPRLLRASHPGEDFHVQLHAYGYSRPAPLHVVPDENVIISCVANFHLRGDGVQDDRTKAMSEYDGWSKVAQHLFWRPNLGSPVGGMWAMPDVSFKQTTEDFHFVAERHCEGLFFDLLWMHWATQGPYYYLLAHLAWDPRADGLAIMDDYYERAFGPAAAELKAYWMLLEQTRMEFVKELPNKMRYYDIPKKYTPELLAKARSLLDAAAAKTASADEKFRRRVAFMRCGFDYTNLVVETRAAMQKFEASKGKDAAARDLALAHWDLAAKMKESFPAFAINW
ncbi:MAG TPA: DUF4838 domain-containing protein, partial [Verrucomicrobiaceae bacterium]